MATLDATEVRVAADGHIYIGAVDATPPTDVTTTIDDDVYTDLGYASEDGVTLTPSLDTDEIMAWQSVTAVRRIVTGSTLELGFTLIQTNVTNMGLYLNAVRTGNHLDLSRAPSPLERSLLIESIDGAEVQRIYVARAQLTDTGEITLARGDAVGYEMTWTALPSATEATPLATVFFPAGAVTVTAVTPDTGGQGDVVAVTITGTGFTEDAVVTVSGTGVTVSAVTVVSDTSITATFTVGALATIADRSVTVTNTDTGTATLAASFDVTA